MNVDICTREGFSRRLAPLADDLVVLARRLVDGPDEVEDVLQTALASAWKHRVSFADDTNFRAWILRFVVNESWNANRRRSRNRVRSSPLPDELADGGFWNRLDADLAYRDLLADPGALLERLDADLAGALKSINLQERTVLLLRAVAGLSCAEIAAVLEVPRGTVLARLFRARVKLRERLGTVSREVGRSVRRAKSSDVPNHEM